MVEHTWHILKQESGRSKCCDCTEEVPPELVSDVVQEPSAADVVELTAPDARERLARGSPGDEAEARLSHPATLAGPGVEVHRPDVACTRTECEEMAFYGRGSKRGAKGFAGLFIELDTADGHEAGTLQAERQTAGASEQAQNGRARGVQGGQIVVRVARFGAECKRVLVCWCNFCGHMMRPALGAGEVSLGIPRRGTTPGPLPTGRCPRPST